MKKNKKNLPEIPEMEVNDAYEKGSVGEFIELLKHFPENAKFTLNGTADIDAEDIGGLESGATAATIYPRENVYDEFCDCCNDSKSEKYIAEDENPYEADYDDAVVEGYFRGIARYDHDFLDSMRETITDKLMESPVVSANKNELAYEEKMLYPHQSSLLYEMRDHNNFVAEIMSEVYRRQLSALLEYNTQCIAHFGIATNRSMCEIIGDMKEDN